MEILTFEPGADVEIARGADGRVEVHFDPEDTPKELAAEGEEE